MLAHLRKQTRPLSALHELVITHEGAVADDDRVVLEGAAGRGIRFVELPAGTGYYEAKEVGFDATDSDVVVFADGDCWPDHRWLDALLQPFDDDDAGDVKVVAGRTVYRSDVLGIAATTIDFMYFPSPFGKKASRNFYANNVAFRRPVFDRLRYAADGFYRGNCQVAGMKLVENGVAVRFVAAARTVHRFPDSARELVQLRLLRGEDTVVLSGHLRDRALPERARWLMDLGAVSPALVLAGRFVCSVASVNHQDMPEVRGLKRVAVVGAIAGLTLIDAAGALRGSSTKRAAAKQKHKTTTLSYHADGDGLSAA